MKTQQEINSAIERLKTNKQKSKSTTGFGDDAHGAIDVMIRVLEEDLSNEEIYYYWEDDEHNLSSALSAFDYKNDEIELDDILYPEQNETL